jgi:hypothetical protein
MMSTRPREGFEVDTILCEHTVLKATRAMRTSTLLCVCASTIQSEIPHGLYAVPDFNEVPDFNDSSLHIPNFWRVLHSHPLTSHVFGVLQGPVSWNGASQTPTQLPVKSRHTSP